MTDNGLTFAARKIETDLEQQQPNKLQTFVRDETARKLEGRGLSLSDYKVFVVRQNKDVGEELLVPQTLHVATYSEKELYGSIGSDIVRFRSLVRAIATVASNVAALDPETVEYGHQVALLWADVGKVKEFIGVDPSISEIAAELRTLRYSMIGRDTPQGIVAALASALELVVRSQRVDHVTVDRFVDALTEGGYDPFAQDALRND